MTLAQTLVSSSATSNTYQLAVTPSKPVAGEYYLSIYDDQGAAVYWDGGPSYGNAGANAMTVSVPINVTRTYTAYVSRDRPNAGPPVLDVRAISGRYSTAAPGPLAANEISGGSNPSEACSQRCHGDPVNSVTGEFWEATSDLSVPGPGPALALTRSYATSQRSVDGTFGYGWRSSLDMALAINVGASGSSLATADQVKLTQENGSVVVFSRAGDGTYSAPARVQATLTTTGGLFVFTRQQKQKYTFNSTGQLVSMADLAGNTVTLAYTGAKVTSLTNGRAQTLTLTWSGNHLIGVRDHKGRTVSYTYSTDGAHVNLPRPAVAYA